MESRENELTRPSIIAAMLHAAEHRSELLASIAGSGTIPIRALPPLGAQSCALTGRAGQRSALGPTGATIYCTQSQQRLDVARTLLSPPSG